MFHLFNKIYFVYLSDQINFNKENQYMLTKLLIRHFVCFECVTMVRIYYNLQKKKPYFRRIV